MKLLAQDIQRLWDLVRYQRAALHVAELITDDEYAILAADDGAVARLEEYDRMVTARIASNCPTGNCSHILCPKHGG